MSLPNFTAETSLYQSTQRYTMASSTIPTRGGGLASIAATINPFMPPGGGGGGGDGGGLCFPKGCGQCNYPGYRQCSNQDYPDCTTHQESCDWYSSPTCTQTCTELHCNGGTCNPVYF